MGEIYLQTSLLRLLGQTTRRVCGTRLVQTRAIPSKNLHGDPTFLPYSLETENLASHSLSVVAVVTSPTLTWSDKRPIHTTDESSAACVHSRHYYIAAKWKAIQTLHHISAARHPRALHLRRKKRRDERDFTNETTNIHLLSVSRLWPLKTRESPEILGT